jgi:N-methylhydantoinase B
MSNTMNTPAEVLETAYPLRVRRYALRPDSAGAGEHRGGLGLRRDIQALAPTAFSVLADRQRNPPYGLAGGEPGATGEVRLNGEQIPAKSAHDLDPGDVVSLRTPGGGGHGDPADRDPDAVARDLELGKLSAAAAREWYGYSTGSGE